MLLVSEAGLASVSSRLTEIVGRGHSVAFCVDGDLTKLTTSADAVSKAYDDGVTAGDIDVAEVLIALP